MYTIGIDSGGTHISALALGADGTELGSATAGPGNSFLNADGTLKNLTSVIEQLTTMLTGETCTHVLIGVAGVSTAANGEWLRDQLEQRFDLPITIINDAELALINGLKGDDGILAIAGTGSIIYARVNNQTQRYGGWGQVLGDTGSAYAITVRALKAVLHDFDNGRKNGLQMSLIHALKADTVPGAVRKFYQLNREEIASLAVIVAKEADNNNHDAQRIITQEATALAQEIIGLADRINNKDLNYLALSGSVLTHNTDFRETLLKVVHTVYPTIESIVVNTNNAHASLYWQKWISKGE